MEEALDQGIMLYEELLGVLVDVTDEASARAAADEVERISAEFEELEKRMGDYSDEEIARAAVSTRFFGFASDLGEEMMRISTNPDALALLGAAFESLGGEGPSPTPVSTGGGTLATVTSPTGDPTAAPLTGDLSAGGSACLQFGQLIAKFTRAADPNIIFEIAESARSLQTSGAVAEEEEIRDAIQGMANSVDSGIPDVSFAGHMEAMTQACLTYYGEEYLKGFTG